MFQFGLVGRTGIDLTGRCGCHWVTCYVVMQSHDQFPLSKRVVCVTIKTSSPVSAQTERRERCRAGEELHMAVSLTGRFSSKGHGSEVRNGGGVRANLTADP